jgi:hypothetical protein
MFTEHMLRMITISNMGHCTWPFDRLTTRCCSTKRIVGFVVVVSAKGFAIEDVEAFVGEWFMTSVTIKAVLVIFTFKLTIGGRDGRFLDGKIATTTLGQIHILPASLAKDCPTVHLHPLPVFNPLLTPYAHSHLPLLPISSLVLPRGLYRSRRWGAGRRF